jgi:molybdopterin molybdotransferase
MIPFQDACSIVMKNVRPMLFEKVGCADAAGRILAEAIHSDMDFPPFDRAQMDGFAARQQDLAQSLDIIETVPAGKVPTRSVGSRQATRIMTGAPVPEGADVVFKVEESRLEEDGQVRFCGPGTEAHIARRGTDLQRGDKVLEPGTLLSANHIATLASVGAAEVMVARQPRVAIVATGDELVEPGILPGPGQIRNASSSTLQVQTIRAGGVPHYRGICSDRKEHIFAALSSALADSDVVLMTGGVSMGDFDLVPELISEAGLEILFDRVALKPGKPATFAVGEAGVVFGMPGNPVSTFVVFELLVRPFLAACMGVMNPVKEKSVVLGADFRRRRASRLEWIPVLLDEHYRAFPIPCHGSAHFAALCRADGLVAVPIGVEELHANQQVTLRVT